MSKVKYVISALLFLPVLVLGALMLDYAFLGNYQEVRVVMAGYDPKDFFAGYYINMRPDWKKTDCGQFADNICPQERFSQNYRYYINIKESAPLTKAVNEGIIEMVFAYYPDKEPRTIDLLIDGVSYEEYAEFQAKQK